MACRVSAFTPYRGRARLTQSERCQLMRLRCGHNEHAWQHHRTGDGCCAGRLPGSSFLCHLQQRQLHDGFSIMRHMQTAFMTHQTAQQSVIYGRQAVLEMG